MTKPKSAGARPTRECIFCGANANSKEHFWSRWLHPIVSDARDRRHGRQVYTYHPMDGANVMGPSDRQGGRQTIRIRVVCRECNQGWMNDLEQAVRPVLSAMAEGRPFFFTESDQLTVARWVTLKCLVVENDKPELTVTPAAERRAFMERLEIPGDFRIYATAQDTGISLGFSRHTHRIVLPEGPVVDLTDQHAKNTQTLSFLVGKCFFHVNAARADGIEIERFVPIPQMWDHARIWPTQEAPRPWPHTPILGVNGIRMVSDVLPRLIGSRLAAWI